MVLKPKKSTNPNRRPMSVDVQASFRGIQRMNEEALRLLEKRGRIKLSQLIPRSKEQKIRFSDIQGFPEKYELINGKLLWSEEEKKCVINTVLAEIGLSKFVSMLPQQSKKELRQLLCDSTIND
jgi:hypothetical protein